MTLYVSNPPTAFCFLNAQHDTRRQAPESVHLGVFCHFLPLQRLIWSRTEGENQKAKLMFFNQLPPLQCCCKRSGIICRWRLVDGEYIRISSHPRWIALIVQPPKWQEQKTSLRWIFLLFRVSAASERRRCLGEKWKFPRQHLKMTGHCSGERSCVCWQVCTYCEWSVRGSKRDVNILKPIRGARSRAHRPDCTTTCPTAADRRRDAGSSALRRTVFLATDHRRKPPGRNGAMRFGSFNLDPSKIAPLYESFPYVLTESRLLFGESCSVHDGWAILSCFVCRVCVEYFSVLGLLEL